MNDLPPHFVNTEDVNGTSCAYWTQTLYCSDGHVVCGVGSNAELAAQAASSRRELHESKLLDDPRTQIQKILAKGQDYPCAQDQGTLNRAFAKLLGCI